MGDANIKAVILKTLPSTTGGYSSQKEGGVRPKGLCHVTCFIQHLLVSFVDFTSRKLKAVARSTLHDFYFSGLSVMTFSFFF